jgi:5S rRNA maturation endonuclease (ribonuclease M5)
MTTAADIERAERIRQVFDAMIEANKHVPVIVEGKKDAEALRRLGLEGEILTIHRGKGLYELSEEIADRYPAVVLLVDWDDTGESLFRTLTGNIRGHWEEYADFRELLKMLCQKEIRDIEGIPALLGRLEGNE